MTEPTQVTQLLHLARTDRDSAFEKLMPLVYEELRGLARSYLQRERKDHTLEPTALVHEAYLRVVDQDLAGLQDRVHFFAISARLMRQILIDHARRKNAVKRKGERLHMTVERLGADGEKGDFDIVDLSDALDRLTEMDERKARVVELRFFGGLEIQEIADVLEVSKRTVEADWFFARAWLRGELGSDD